MTTEIARGINLVQDHWSHSEDRMLWRCVVTLEGNGDLYSYPGHTEQDAIAATTSELEKIRDELDHRINQLKGISRD